MARSSADARPPAVGCRARTSLAHSGFALRADVLECPRCHGPMKILAAIHPTDTAGAIFECRGLTARPPLLVPPRPAAARLFESDPDCTRD